MDLFSLIIVPNPAKVKIGTLPRAAHEVPLLTATANRVIDMEDMTGMSGSSRTPSTVEKSPLDFSNEDPPLLITERIGTGEQGYNELSKGISPVGNPPYTEVAPEPNLEKETVTIGAFVNKRRHKRGPDEVKANAPPKVLRKDHVVSHLLQSMSDMDPLSYAKPPLVPEQDIANKGQECGTCEGIRKPSRMSEGLKHGVEHGKAKVDLAAIKAYDPNADTKYVLTLHALKDLKYPLVDKLEKLKDAPIDVIMSSLYLESDSGEDAPLLIHELCPILNRAKKEKKCRVVCRTHGVGSAHQATSDGVPVSVPTIAPQGLAILLAGAAIQTNMTEDDASPKLFRSKSLPPMYNLDWP
nr:hypothetical protein [Tanacetum cinerariifolium]